MKKYAVGKFKGSMVALVTPFKDGRIDEAAFISLCERQIRCGSAALVPCGTTGEASTLTHQEQSRLIELSVWAARGRVPVIAGAGSNCTVTTIGMVAEAKRLGADAVLCIVPYYNRPSQEGLYQHFLSVQSESNLPVILYDVPKRTGVALELETIVRLSELPNIIGIKDASGDLARAARMRHYVAPEFLRLCGDDALVPSFLTLGSQGAISVTANVVPALCAALHRAWVTYDTAKLQRISSDLDPLNKALFLESNPVPVKWLLSRLGLIQGELRLPLVSLNERFHAQILDSIKPILPAEAEAMISVDLSRSIAAE
ncbi:4-hydroxy-tetrahydrodipicolinate synthase [Magnetospirillum molischianum]|uniref:4-hydroxy-tetrahydrodipicolinate synthase n=1 Tax=Magnetospirillum molischianum DSM 120 TaxID=1150626 RepID=H8FPF1_MAGML|nr:4-hydroxy-tetrahydrodipicolinate synthase [Magnetospirillum molischianum]CCG40239.1 Dihydrodipicolinate synthase [Magnetospirillum molischianum DSM 120]